jgi:uncharacterized protein (DUF58 family)
MLPTLRLLLFLLLGSLLVAGVALAPALRWLALAYLVAVAILVVADYLTTTRPHEIEVERINDTKLSLGADNLITLLLANRGRRPVRFQVRDEYPYRFNSDATILAGEIAPYDIHEARYHVRPLQRGDYSFGDINIRYISTLKTFVRQVRYPATAQVKVYPNVLDVRKYDLLARKGLLLSWGCARRGSSVPAPSSSGCVSTTPTTSSAGSTGRPLRVGASRSLPSLRPSAASTL